MTRPPSVAIRNEMIDDRRPGHVDTTLEDGVSTDEEPDYGMFEDACHEGNYGLRNILSGSRADERNGR